MSTPLVKALQGATGLGEAQILRLIVRSPHTYKVYSIPKKTGGDRVIAQPAKETKFLQRWLIANVFGTLPIHESASAYKTDASIKKNAAAHRQNPYISKFDFKNFFPSIKESDLIAHITKHLGTTLCEEDVQYVARLCSFITKGMKVRSLSVGAPSSPLLSNSIMFEFDSMISSWCRANGLTYTRYADDLTFSTKNKGISFEIEPMICEVISNLTYPRLVLNRKKTVHLSKKYQRRVTGIIVNNDDQLSIGRERKRAISALIHRHSIKLLTLEETYHLQGLLGFANDIEPTFVASMRKKYGAQLIDEIFRIRK